MDVTAQVLHDWLLEKQPEGASHEACAMCAAKASKEENVSGETSLTQEQHEQLLVSAVEKATTSAVANAKAAVDAEVLQLNESLKEAQTALATKDEAIAALQAQIDEGKEAERLEAVAIERIAQVKAVASFDDEQIKSRRQAWAAMEGPAFAAYLEDIKAVAVKPTTEAPKTVLDTTRATAAEGTEKSAIETFFGVSAVSQAS